MALRFRLSSEEHAALAPDRRDDYVLDDDGTFVLDFADPAEAEKYADAKFLKAKLLKLREELHEPKQTVRAFREQFGKSPAEIAAIIAHAEALPEPTGSMSEEEFTRIRAEQDANHAREIADLQAQIDAGIKPKNDQIIALRSEMETRQIVTALGADYTLLAPHIAKHCRFSADDPIRGPLRVEVLDPTGAVRLHADGRPVTLPQLLEEWRTLSPSLSLAFKVPLAHQLSRNDTNGDGKH